MRVRASRNAASSLPSFSCPWHLLKRAFVSFGNASSATRKKKQKQNKQIY